MTLCIFISSDGIPQQMNLDIDDNQHGKILNETDGRVSFVGLLGDDIVVCQALIPVIDSPNPIKFNCVTDNACGPLVLIRMDADSNPQPLHIEELSNFIE